MITRIISEQIRARLFKGKAIIILGPRQSGKTTLVQSILQDYPDQYRLFNGDEPDIRELFLNASSGKLKSLMGEKRIMFIDEAQRISEIGISIKLMVDTYPDIQVIATGSSALELTGHLREPLTGRKYEYLLLPLTYPELVQNSGRLAEDRQIPHRLIFGYYPEVVSNPGYEKELLKLLADSYLFKDLFNLG